LLFSGILLSLGWYLVSDVSVQPIGPILKGKKFPENLFGLLKPWRWDLPVVPKRR